MARALATLPGGHHTATAGGARTTCTALLVTARALAPRNVQKTTTVTATVIIPGGERSAATVTANRAGGGDPCLVPPFHPSGGARAGR